MTTPERPHLARALLGAALAAATVLAAAPAAHASFAGPTGKNGKIAFVRNGDVWAINADGNGLQQITTNPAPDTSPAWSPDGETVAFARLRNGNWDIWTIVPDGSVPIQITSSDANESAPAWSPDGRRLIFARTNPADPFVNDLVVVDRTGANAELIQPRGTSPDWSRAGIAFGEGDPGPLQLVDHTGGNRRDFPGTDWQPSADVDAAPSWAPDASRVAYTRVRRSDAGTTIDLHIATRSGNNIFVSSGASDPSWSPDGRQIAFVRSNQIWVTGTDGSGERLVTTNPAGADSPSWQPQPVVPVPPVTSGDTPDPAPPTPIPQPATPPAPAAPPVPPAGSAGAPSGQSAQGPSRGATTGGPGRSAAEGGKTSRRLPRRPRLEAVSYPRAVSLGRRVTILARFDRPVTVRYVVLHRRGSRYMRVGVATTSGKRVTMSYRPSRAGFYRFRVQYRARGAVAIRTVQVRVT